MSIWDPGTAFATSGTSQPGRIPCLPAVTNTVNQTRKLNTEADEKPYKRNGSWENLLGTDKNMFLRYVPS